jgi:hypothetical protein
VPSLLQDLGVVETVLGDVSAFAAGKPVNGSIDGYAVSVVVLPEPAAPYTVIGGGFFAILTAALGLAAEFAAGTPIQIAVKENVTWYGVTLSPKAAPASA